MFTEFHFPNKHLVYTEALEPLIKHVPVTISTQKAFCVISGVNVMEEWFVVAWTRS